MNLLLRGGAADPDWLSITNRLGRSDLERRMIAAGLDPNKVFAMAKVWLLTSEVSVTEIAERVEKILEAFEDAAAGRIPVADRSAHVFEGTSTDARIQEWSEPQKYRLYQKIDLSEVIRNTRTLDVEPNYSVHPAKLQDAEQGTPSADNGSKDDIQFVDLTAPRPIIPALRRTATEYFQNAKKFRSRFGFTDLILVKGVGTVTTSEDEDREKIKFLQKRIEDLRRRGVVGAPGPYSEPFPVVTNQYSSRGLELWPQDFLEERIGRWKNVFFGRIFDWYIETRDGYDLSLKTAGWLHEGSQGGGAANPALPGNDVRANALSLFEERALIPAMHKVERILNSEFDFLELSLAKEEVQDLVFEGLEGEEPGVDRTTAARGAWARNVLRLHPPPDLLSVYRTYLQIRGRTLETHPAPRWISESGRGEKLPEMETTLEILRGYLDAELAKAITKNVETLVRDDVVSVFFAQQLDARVLADLTLTGTPLTAEETPRSIAYSDAPTDPSYELLIRLAAFPDPKLVREMREANPLAKKLSLFPGRVEESGAAAADVRTLNLRFYARPFSTRFGPEGDSEPFIFWMKRMRAALPNGLKEGISDRERADINEYSVQNARFELLRALEAVTKVKETDAIFEVRMGNQSSVFLRPRVPAWPPNSATATFELRLNRVRGADEPPGGEEVLRTLRVSSPREDEEVKFDLGEWPEAGDYVVKAEAFDANGDTSGDGFSVKFRVKRIARCARCAGDFDLGRQEVTPPGFSKECRWKTKIPIRDEKARESLIDWILRMAPTMTRTDVEFILGRIVYSEIIRDFYDTAQSEEEKSFFGALEKKLKAFERRAHVESEERRLRLAPTSRSSLDRRRVRSNLSKREEEEPAFSFAEATLEELKKEIPVRWSIDASEIDVCDGRERELSVAEWEFVGSHSVNNPFPDVFELKEIVNTPSKCALALERLCKDYEALYAGMFLDDGIRLTASAEPSLVYGSFRASRESEQDALAKEVKERAAKLVDDVRASRGVASNLTLRTDYEDVVRLIKKFNELSFGEAYTGMK